MTKEMKQCIEDIAKNISIKNPENVKLPSIEEMAQEMLIFNIKTTYLLAKLGITIEDIETNKDTKSVTYYLILPDNYIDIYDTDGNLYTIQSAAKEAKRIIKEVYNSFLETIKSYSKYTNLVPDSDYETHIAYTRCNIEWTKELKEESIINLKKEIKEKFEMDME